MTLETLIAAANAHIADHDGVMRLASCPTCWNYSVAVDRRQ